MDLLMMGVPCPLFSALNQKSKPKLNDDGTEKVWDPFRERLVCHRGCNRMPRPGSEVIKSCLRKARRINAKAIVIEEVAGTAGVPAH